MNSFARLTIASLIVAAAAATPLAASAMPAPPKDAVAQSSDAAGLEQVHAVRVCRHGRCWWSHSGHHHGGWGWHGGHHGHYGRHWGHGGHHGRHW